MKQAHTSRIADPVSTHRFAMDTDAPAALCGVYAIEHVESGRVYVGYVGGTNGRGFAKRCQEHFYNATFAKAQHTKSRFGHFVRKYGSEGFVFHVMAVIDQSCPHDEFVTQEQVLIDAMDAAGPQGFNLHPHATTPRGTRRSDETRAKMSASRKKMLAENPELLAVLTERAKALGRSEESKVRTAKLNADPEFQRMRVAALSAARADPEYAANWRGKMNAYWSNPERMSVVTEVTRARMAEPAMKNKMSRIMSALNSDPAHQAKASAGGRTPEARAKKSIGIKLAWARRKLAAIESMEGHCVLDLEKARLAFADLSAKCRCPVYVAALADSIRSRLESP